MPVIWNKPTDEMLVLTEELIAEFHPNLAQYRIGVISWEGSRSSGGKEILGKAGKVPPKMKPLLSDDDLDGLIELSGDFWFNIATDTQKRALIDHELCHLRHDDKKGLVVVGHDIEEFNEIIRRYGSWMPEMEMTEGAFLQRAFGFAKAKTGGVVSVHPAYQTKDGRLEYAA